MWPAVRSRLAGLNRWPLIGWLSFPPLPPSFVLLKIFATEQTPNPETSRGRRLEFRHPRSVSVKCRPRSHSLVLLALLLALLLEELSTTSFKLCVPLHSTSLLIFPAEFRWSSRSVIFRHIPVPSFVFPPRLACLCRRWLAAAFQHSPLCSVLRSTSFRPPRLTPAFSWSGRCPAEQPKMAAAAAAAEKALRRTKQSECCDRFEAPSPQVRVGYHLKIYRYCSLLKFLWMISQFRIAIHRTLSLYLLYGAQVRACFVGFWEPLLLWFKC